MFSLTATPADNGFVILALTGNVSEEVLPEIHRLIDRGRRIDGRVALDLSEVTLMDRMSARFFAEQIQRGIELVDCPSYLKRWILREITNDGNDK
jgi:anti-anti-sigma regulatory factor